MKRPVGVIDTGSNTVLGVIFRWDEEKNCYRNFDLSDGRVVHAKLIGYVQDGRLLESGLEALKEALREIRGFFAEKEPELMTVRCFATASLRGIVNFDAAAAAAAEVGYRIELLSGEEEAECDFAGMLQEMEWMEAAAENGARFPSGGVAVDMGGGSGQLLCFTGREENGLAAFESFPIGCLKLTRQFIQKGEQPTDAELKA
ncbi:MAG: hypothetical protein IKM31_04580, partial [Oscillospiraceae bacterium]|nr:hypothetical protein [Oscillospiraceae bacterium]